MIANAVAKFAVFILVLAQAPLYAAEFSKYRGFEFGSSPAAALKNARTDSSGIRVVHRRPALIQEIDWVPSQPGNAHPGPVREGILRFFNGSLYQIAVTYDRQYIEGLTEADLITAISQHYGASTKPETEIAFHSNYGEFAPVIARWENPDYSYNLVRLGDQTSYALIMNLKRLDAQAQAAIAEAKRLDVLDAPQRAIDQKIKQDSERRQELDKARSINLPNFRP